MYGTERTKVRLYAAMARCASTTSKHRMLTYTCKGLGLSGLANRRELTIRFFQFFDHFPNVRLRRSG
jgi:hypothetical protein